MSSSSTSDGKMQAFLVCMWVVMLMGTLGGEIRFLLRNGEALFAVLIVLGFYVACFLMRTWLIDQAVFKPHIKRGNKKLHVQLQPAIAQVRDYVLGRAAQLGIPGMLHVYYIPGTWTSVDAYVFGASSNQIVVVSGGLQALYGASDAPSADRFRFVIDHELGHIAARDTDLLYLARATIIVGAALLALKFIFISVLGPDLTLRVYGDVFPRSIGPQVFSSVIPFPSMPAKWFVISFFALFAVFCMGISAYFYVMIARRREHLADRYAVSHSSDSERAMQAMEALLSGSALTTAPPHAFLGSLRWHPPAKERLNNIALASIAAIPEIIGIVMVVLTIMTIRFMLGDITAGREDLGSGNGGLIMASAAYALVIGTVIELLLNDGTVRTHRERLKYIAAEMGRLVWWTAVVSVCLVVLAYMFASPSSQIRGSMEGVEYLVNVETLERTLLLLSAPVAVAGFGLANFLLSGFAVRASSFSAKAGFTVASSSLAIVILFGAGLLASIPLAALRQSSFDLYWKHRALAFETGKTANERKLEGATLAPDVAAMLKEFRENSLFPRRDVRDELDMLPKEAQLYATRIAHPFAPPFSFIALWQAPLRSTLF